MKKFLIAFFLLALPFMGQAADKKGQIIQDIPFIVQAPTGNWKDIRLEDGCEETTSFMAVLWARGERATSSKKNLEKQLLAISDFEQKKYGSYQDTSASSTAKRILSGYFKFSSYQYKAGAAKSDLIQELEKGGIIIAPMNGRKLGNPYFSNGGPEEHMVLIKGYDYDKKEFITNDPGTRRGDNYRYNEDVLYSAIRDYPTGEKHLPIIGERKNIIVIHK